MDLEEHARNLFINGNTKDKIVKDLSDLTGSEAKAQAILMEIINSENISDGFVRDICNYPRSGFSADYAGLGCRGEGDFFIHHKIAELIENQESKDGIGGTIIDPKAQDDGGVVQVGKNYITVSVDGMHSRLSHFPFIAGFHASRAAIRDTLVMGCEPKALFSDIHLANDGDVGKIFDYTAGIATVSEVTGIPLISGSTLRIGGDLVLGDRITGCVGCMGVGQQLTPRQNASAGDVLVMTEGNGGGTIATTALYYGHSEIVTHTLNLSFISLVQLLLKSDLLADVHALTDVTNGGIRGDAFEIAQTAKVRITLFEDEFNKLVNPAVLEMLKNLDIDPLGISIDSLLLILPEEHAAEILKFIHDTGVPASIIGEVHGCHDNHGRQGPAVQLLKGDSNNLGSISDPTTYGEKCVELKPQYREEPYTPIKKVVNIEPDDQKVVQNALEVAMKDSQKKKEKLKNWLVSKRRGNK